MKYTYTKDDINFLKENYPNGNWDKIMNRFPFLSKNAIYKKCYRIGITSENTHRKNFDNSKSRQKWSKNEEQILIDSYSAMPIKDVCALLPNRTKDMIANKAVRMDLNSYMKSLLIWKPEEIDYIIKNWEVTPDRIMANHLNRTFRAVKYKREELGLFRQNPDDNSYPTLSKYLRSQNQKWKKESMLSCDYKCVLTGTKNFEIHHLYGVSNIINDMLNEYPKYRDISFSDYSDKALSFLLEEFLKRQKQYPLGVCVNKNLHILFHSMYGQYYNTPEQWYKFCEDYKKGIYDKYV